MTWPLPLFLVISLVHSSPPTYFLLFLRVLALWFSWPETLFQNFHMTYSLIISTSSDRPFLTTLSKVTNSIPHPHSITLTPFYHLCITYHDRNLFSIHLFVNSLPSLTPLPFEYTFLKIRDSYLSDCYLLFELQSPAEGLAYRGPQKVFVG